MKFLAIFILCLALAFNTNGQDLPDLGEFNFWNLGRNQRNIFCVRSGFNAPGFFGAPPFEDPWFILVASCNSYDGSSSCQNEAYNEDEKVVVGTCSCNQLDYQQDEYDDEFFPLPCLGKVGAVCTAAQTSFIPEKKCIQNAKCVPDQGEGYTVGHCECLGGYIDDGNRGCMDDGQPGTKEPEPIMPTTPAPERSEIPLPLDLLIGLQWVKYDESCANGALLNKTYCNTEGLTVSCLGHLDENNVASKRCQCNLEDDSIFDEKLNMCVSLAGGWCNVRKNLLGWKVCAEGADCFLQEGEDIDDYSFGQCECLYGYDEQADGTCLRNLAIPNPSTKRPGPGHTTEPPPTTPTTKFTTPTPPPDSASVPKLGGIMALFVAIIYLTI